MSRNKYINKSKRNENEEAVRLWFRKKRYKTLSRGWPDFVFFKNKGEGKIEAIFVEVKRSDQTMIKPHQNIMKKIFEKLGLDVRVCFGIKEDGSPNFKDIKNRRMVG